jgi:hypothetical protein
MENEKTIHIPTFDEALSALGDKISRSEADHLADLLQACSVSHGQSYRLQKYRELKEAESAVDHLQQRKSEQQGLVAAAAERLAGLSEGGWVVGMMFIAGFVACFGAEFVFNWAILPWMLGVPPRSVLGIALAVAPATAPVVLDRILARLLGVTDSIDALASASGLTARVRSVARTIFLIVAGAATLYSIWVLADSRAIASAIMNSDTTTGLNALQQHVVDLSLLLVSLVLTVNGALFYLFGTHELKHFVVAWKARAEVARLRVLLNEITSNLAKAAPPLEAARGAWDQIDKLEKSVVETLIAHGKTKLAQAMARPEPPQPAHVRVKEILDRRLGLGSAKA